MVEDEDDIIVESSKNLPKITEDGSDMIDCEDDDAISILYESDAVVESDNELEDTLLDIDGEFESVVDPSQLKFVFSSYLPCAAHNGQLVLKDGLKLDEPYTKLIKKVSHDIVSKTKCSNLIAEEIRKIEKVLKTYVITRWNSILFMIRSVLKLTPEDFKRLRSKMNQNTVKQKEAKEKFNLSHTERAMLIELEKL